MQPIFAKNGVQFLQKLNVAYDEGRGLGQSSSNSTNDSSGSLINHFRKLRLSSVKPNKSKSTEGYHLICYSTYLFQEEYIQCFIPCNQIEFTSLTSDNQRTRLSKLSFRYLYLEKNIFADILKDVEFVELKRKADVK